jgi:hypothetical protein
MRSVLKPVAWLCLLLTIVSAYSFAAHQHSNPLDEAKCSICVVAHSASPVAFCALPSAIMVLVQVVVLTEPRSARQRFIPFALSVRPPPAI